MTSPERQLLAPAFPDDTGEVDPALAAALGEFARDPARFPEALAALQDARVLVPVVAVLGEVEIDQAGLARDKSADMAAVLLTGADGRLALLGFSSTDDPDGLGPGGASGARHRPYRRARRPSRRVPRRWCWTSPGRRAWSSRASTCARSRLAGGWPGSTESLPGCSRGPGRDWAAAESCPRIWC